jgi:diadenosine tetraphosphate (Ap4A) HIT family hydrolase
MTLHEQIKASPVVLYSDKALLLVLDLDPITKGHALILPQESYQDLDDVPLALLTRLFQAAQAYIRVMKSQYSPKGYSIMQNGGIFNDLDVFHLHVFSRFKENEFGHRYTAPTEALEVQLLKKYLHQEMNK